MARIITLIICALVAGAPSAFSAQREAGPLLDEADALLFDMRLDEARTIYETALEERPGDYEALWRMSRLYLWRGMVAEEKKDKKEAWQTSKDYARRAAEVEPDRAEGHLYAAMSSGKIARMSSGGEKVKASRQIKEEAEKAIELDPTDPMGYLTLGAWHRSVATASSIEKQLAKMLFGQIPKGTLEESLRFLTKAITLGGANVKYHYELAMTYEAMGDYAAAKKEFNSALSADSAYPEDGHTKETIEKELSKSKYK